MRTLFAALAVVMAQPGTWAQAQSPATVLASAPARPGDAAGSPAGAVVVNETAYCRSYVQFGIERLSPAGLKADGEKFLGRGGLEALKNRVKWLYNQKLLPAEKEFTEADWMEDVFYSFQWLQYGGDRGRADMFADTPAPPENWPAVEFDDSAWLYQRKPLLVGPEFSQGWYRRAGYFRFAFDVPDPALPGRSPPASPGRSPATGTLKLLLVYRGGTRVFINGSQIARGHLGSTGGTPVLPVSQRH